MRHLIVAWLDGTYPASDTARRRAGWLTLARERVARWRERARSRRALQDLDARLLHDIGVTPADVEREYRKHFWHP